MYEYAATQMKITPAHFPFDMDYDNGNQLNDNCCHPVIQYTDISNRLLYYDRIFILCLRCISFFIVFKNYSHYRQTKDANHRISFSSEHIR